MTNRPAAPERILVGLLRLFGTTALLALVFVAAPHAWMREIHAWLGMGTLPDSPVVWYLARSTSALYAGLGGLLWVTSFDPARFQPVLRFFALGSITFGLAMFVIDVVEGMPTFWTYWEGPVLVTYGVVVAILLPEGEEVTGRV